MFFVGLELTSPICIKQALCISRGFNPETLQSDQVMRSGRCPRSATCTLAIRPASDPPPSYRKFEIWDQGAWESGQGILQIFVLLMAEFDLWGRWRVRRDGMKEGRTDNDHSTL